MSLHPLGGAAEVTSEQEPLCVFGTGDMGRSLGQRLLQTGYKVAYGSRRPLGCGPVPQGAQVTHMARLLHAVSRVTVVEFKRKVEIMLDLPGQHQKKTNNQTNKQKKTKQLKKINKKKPYQRS